MTVVDPVVLEVWSLELDAYVLDAYVLDAYLLVGVVAAVEARRFSPLLRR